MFTESHFFSHDNAADKPRERLRRHNLTWEQPTKTFQTRKVRGWLEELELPEIDRLETDQLRAQWDLWEKQLEGLEKRIEERFQQGESTRTPARSGSEFTKGWLGVQPERKRTSATEPESRTATTHTHSALREDAC